MVKAEIISLNHRQQAINRAVGLLKAEELVALPTETVYGLAGDAQSRKAVARIYEVKGRPAANPLIAHIADREMAERYCYIPEQAKSLMERFWPGPLSLVLELRPDAPIAEQACAGLKTLALRCPQGVFGEIIKDFGAALVAPSANHSGRLSPTSAGAVYDDLKNDIKLIIDGGPCAIGLESTIIKIDKGELRLLRPGGLARSEVERYSKLKLTDRPQAPKKAAESAKTGGSLIIEAPGMLTSHYAPRAMLRLNICEVNKDEALLSFGAQEVKGAKQARYCLNLSPKGCLEEAAYNLFAYLKELDKPDIKIIAVQPIPMLGLGEAINDRLKRAAAPRHC